MSALLIRNGRCRKLPKPAESRKPFHNATLKNSWSLLIRQLKVFGNNSQLPILGHACHVQRSLIGRSALETEPSQMVVEARPQRKLHEQAKIAQNVQG